MNNLEDRILLGSGSSRNVYLHNNYALKESKNLIGIIQNETEVFLKTNYNCSLLNNIQRYSTNYERIIVDKANILTIENTKEIFNCEIKDILIYWELHSHRLKDNLYEMNKLLFHNKLLSDYIFNNTCENKNLLKIYQSFSKLIKTIPELRPFDLKKLSSWGIVNNNLKLIDFGITENNIKIIKLLKK